MYIVLLAVIIVLVIKIIWNWSDTSSLLGRFLSVITPFVMGLFIAYLINPLVEFLNRKLFRGIFRIRSKKIYTTSISVIFGILDMIIAVIVSVYMLFDKSKLINNCKRIIYAFLPIDRADNFLVISNECNKIFGNFIIGKMIDSTIIGFLCWIIMMVLGIPYPLVISVIVGVTNMIPYFGPFIGAVPGILLLIIVDFYYAIIFTILIIVLQQFDGLFLGPKILGESTGLRPIWIIFAITVGGSIAGVKGMFLGVPVTAVIVYLVDGAISKKLKSRNVKFEVNSETDIITRDNLITEDEDIE